MSDKFDTRDDRMYTRDHEWAAYGGDAVKVGITAFAVDQLGDITLVNLDVKVGDQVARGKAFGTIESVKTLSDLFSPVSGKVVAVNAALETQPELVNEDCYDRGWMIAIAPEGAEDKGHLLSATAYAELLKSL
jgi:glycine cleavage system H protein